MSQRSDAFVLARTTAPLACRPLSEAVANVSSDDGKKRVNEFLATRPYPHFEALDGGLLCRIDEDGTRTIGRFVNRVFVACEG